MQKKRKFTIVTSVWSMPGSGSSTFDVSAPGVDIFEGHLDLEEATKEVMKTYKPELEDYMRGAYKYFIKHVEL